MSLDADDICTHDDVANEVGGATVLEPMLPRELEALTGSAKTLTIRTAALEDALASLVRRQPPVRETDLAQPTELKRAVLYNTMARIFGLAMSSADDAWGIRYREYNAKYRDEITGMRPTVHGGGQVNVASFAMERR